MEGCSSSMNWPSKTKEYKTCLFGSDDCGRKWAVPGLLLTLQSTRIACFLRGYGLLRVTEEEVSLLLLLRLRATVLVWRITTVTWTSVLGTPGAEVGLEVFLLKQLRVPMLIRLLMFLSQMGIPCTLFPLSSLFACFWNRVISFSCCIGCYCFFW